MENTKLSQYFSKLGLSPSLNIKSLGNTRVSMTKEVNHEYCIQMDDTRNDIFRKIKKTPIECINEISLDYRYPFSLNLQNIYFYTTGKRLKGWGQNQLTDSVIDAVTTFLKAARRVDYQKISIEGKSLGGLKESADFDYCAVSPDFPDIKTFGRSRFAARRDFILKAGEK